LSRAASGDLHDYLSLAWYYTVRREYAMAILDTGAPGWTKSDRDGTRAWNEGYLDRAGIAIGVGKPDLARATVLDLWTYQGPQGQSLFQAIDYPLPTATGEVPWPHPEPEFYRYAASDVVHAAAEASDWKARIAIPELQPLPGGDLRALRPAAQHAV